MPLPPLLVMPLDKGPDFFGQNVNNVRNDLFDQFLTFDPVNINGSMCLSASESTLLVSSSKGSDSAGASIKMWKDEAAQDLVTRSRAEPMQDGNAASNHDIPIGSSMHLVKSGRAAGPNLGLLSPRKISLQSPSLKTPPSSPEFLINKKTRARHRPLEGFHKHFHPAKESKLFRKATSPIRKATCPSKMRRSHYDEENLQDWDPQIALDARGFDFGFQNMSISPPTSGRRSESSGYTYQMMLASQQNNSSYGLNPQVLGSYNYQSTENTDSTLTTPPLDMTAFNPSNMHHHTDMNSMAYATPYRGHSSNQFAQTTVDVEYTYDDDTAYSEDQDPVEWGDALSMSLTESYQSSNQQNIQNSNVRLQAELVNNANRLDLDPMNMNSGLTAQMPYAPNVQPFGSRHSPMGSEAGFYAPAAGSASPSLQPHDDLRYTQPQPQNDYAPRPRAMRPEQALSQPRAESFPTTPTPRSHGSSSSSTKKKHSSSHHKRAGATPAAADSGAQKSPPMPKSSKSSGSKSSGSKSSSAAAGGSSFVHLTPKDSTKILTGVAPSGSSKTKARREREAAEKTRRLSQVAVRAVRAVQAAGGSIDQLVEEGILDDPELEEEMA